MASAFAGLLQQERTRRGLTGRGLARLLGASSAHVARITAGTRPPPLDAVERWADVLGLVGVDRRRFLVAALSAHAPASLLREVGVDLPDSQ